MHAAAGQLWLQLLLGRQLVRLRRRQYQHPAVRIHLPRPAIGPSDPAATFSHQHVRATISHQHVCAAVRVWHTFAQQHVRATHCHQLRRCRLHTA